MIKPRSARAMNRMPSSGPQACTEVVCDNALRSGAEAEERIPGEGAQQLFESSGGSEGGGGIEWLQGEQTVERARLSKRLKVYSHTATIFVTVIGVHTQ